MAVAASVGLDARDAVVLQNSNKLTVRLTPCEVLARIAPPAYQVAQLEIEIAQRLAETASPVAALEPRAAPRPYARDGFVITLWTYYASVTPEVAPADYAKALVQLHADMRRLKVTTPHFTDRITEAEQIVASRDQSPALADPDRAFLGGALRRLRQTITDHGAPEQLLHGEPHPGNLLSTRHGPLFIDLETCCRGSVEFDLAHAPEDIALHYPGVDQALLSNCRALVLAMLAAWRWDAADEFPDGPRWGRAFISTLRQGPPWPSLDAMTRRLAGS